VAHYYSSGTHVSVSSTTGRVLTVISCKFYNLPHFSIHPVCLQVLILCVKLIVYFHLFYLQDFEAS